MYLGFLDLVSFHVLPLLFLTNKHDLMRPWDMVARAGWGWDASDTLPSRSFSPRVARDGLKNSTFRHEPKVRFQFWGPTPR